MDDNQQSARGFFKGPRRASFSATPPVVPEQTSHVVQPIVTPPTPIAQSPVDAIQPPAPVAPRPRSGKPNVVLWGLIGVLLAGLTALSYQFYQDYQTTVAKLKVVSPGTLMEKDEKSIVEKVGRHMLLPDETPKVSTLVEVEKLKGEPFYANAQNGDMVVVFSRRALLYRPMTDKIIEIGFIRQVSPTPGSAADAYSGGTFSNATGSSGAEVAGVATSSAKILKQ